MNKRGFLSLLVFTSLIAISISIILFAKGYRLSPKERSLKSTGLLVATSYPDGASVFIDDKLTTATNNTINLNPGFYIIKIVKEGYIPWEKKLRVQGEIVTKTDAQLFPSTPDLRPLTTLGVIAPKASFDNSKIAYIVANKEPSTTVSKDGIWIFNMSGGPLGFNPSQSLQIAKPTPAIDWSEARLYWSPDSKEILAVFFQKPKDKKTLSEEILAAYKLSTDKLNEFPQNVTNQLGSLLTSWSEEKELQEKRVLETLPLEFQTTASSSARNLHFSPDENKVLYEGTNPISIPQIIKPPLVGVSSQAEERNIKPGNTYIYDIKEDKNFEVFKGKLESPTPKPKSTPSPKASPQPQAPNIKELLTELEPPYTPMWLASSRHLAFIENNTIFVMEYDGTNKQAVYGGPFEDNYLFPHPSGSKLIILTNYNKALGATPNLYAINLK